MPAVTSAFNSDSDPVSNQAPPDADPSALAPTNYKESSTRENNVAKIKVVVCWPSSIVLPTKILKLYHLAFLFEVCSYTLRMGICFLSFVVFRVCLCTGPSFPILSIRKYLFSISGFGFHF